jgi:AraC family transcriptional regulator
MATSARPELVSAGRQTTSHCVPSSFTTADTPTVSRTTLLQNGFGLVESLWVVGPRTPKPTAEDYSPDFQVCLPYQGAFVWHVGGDDVVADPNRVLFVAGGEGFRLSQPVHGGYAELIVTMHPPLLGEILGVAEQHLTMHPLFRERSRSADLRLQRLGAECFHRSAREDWEGLAGEEWLVAFLRSSLAAPPVDATISSATTRLLGRAKEYLAAHVSAPIRLSHVARAVGTSPAYLTTIFSRVEGAPLHRYLVQLRLARALIEVPHADDLTALALDLGFSSHSHFTAAFRRAFGCTPSRFRESMRSDARDVNAVDDAIHRR